MPSRSWWCSASPADTTQGAAAVWIADQSRADQTFAGKAVGSNPFGWTPVGTSDTTAVFTNSTSDGQLEPMGFAAIELTRSASGQWSVTGGCVA